MGNETPLWAQGYTGRCDRHTPVLTHPTVTEQTDMEQAGAHRTYQQLVMSAGKENKAGQRLEMPGGEGHHLRHSVREGDI